MTGDKFTISSAELKAEIMRRRYAELLRQPEVFPSAENWNYIISNAMHGLGPQLYRKYLVVLSLDENLRCDYHHLAISEFPVYLRTVDRSYALETVYSDHSSDTDAFRSLVYDCELFDAGRIASLVEEGDVRLAVSLLDAFQPSYDGDDVDSMRYLAGLFTRLPETGFMEERRGLMGRQVRYICPAGHKNPESEHYCRHEDCGLDIYGLTSEDHDRIEEFNRRISILQEML